MSIPYFANNRNNARRPANNNYCSQQFPRSSNRNSMNFTDNFKDFTVSDLICSLTLQQTHLWFLSWQSNFHNSAMRGARAQLHGSTNYPKMSHFTVSNSNDLNSTMQSAIGEKSFSSLFENSSSKASKSAENSTSGSSNNSFSRHDIAPLSHDTSNNEDDDGVYLQISNLDQWYDEISLKHYLMNQLKPITPILSLTIETPSIAKVKVPSVQVSRMLHIHWSVINSRFFSQHPTVCQTSCITFTSQENGT